jgi:hypothetical protein
MLFFASIGMICFDNDGRAVQEDGH